MSPGRTASRSPSPALKRRSQSGRSRSPRKAYSRSPSPRRRSRSPRYSGGRDPTASRMRSTSVDRDRPKPSKTLGAFGLSYRTQEDQLDRTFREFGDIEKIHLVVDPEGRSRGFAFITYFAMEDARDARKALNGEYLDGKKIRVDFSISRGPHGKTPGQYMGRHGRPRTPPRGRGGGGGGGRRPSPDNYGERRRRGRSRSYSPRRY
ncbi:transformer-2 protein homolog alpha-like [Tigriopus californicus]|uniref:transformer-2 protein homolog alpha-like n=1 Tax=Tigriopus californicus TaxID=6832 RepID=UPI0027DA3D94|nr:transformer-2 protein homolog alpha-like [Tigriopus californicus]XP_059094383.1 transformer-2 protein homolog alpha-like [Tigriopus californicus]